jgi:hypothetical protein
VQKSGTDAQRQLIQHADFIGFSGAIRQPSPPVFNDLERYLGPRKRRLCGAGYHWGYQLAVPRDGDSMRHGKVCRAREIVWKNPVGKLRNMQTYYLPFIAIALALAGAAVIAIYV